MTLLEKIECPADLRKLPASDLPQVAREVRDYVLQVVSEKGGHFASNLGSVELTVALHYVFDTPKDKLIWDVGHQSYPHKVLTGRRERFPTIRQRDGLAGFTCRAESDFDHFGAGHASTSISAALGIAEGMRLAGQRHLAVAVIGDGSLTGGLAYEAMNNAGHIPAKNLVVVLNDNDMSIDPNVGALSKFINQAVTHPGYNRMRKEMRSLISSLSEHGVPLDKELKTLPIGQGELLSADAERLDVVLLGIGHGVVTAMEAQRALRAEGLRTGVVNARFVKPLDVPLLKRWIEASRLVVTVEENTILGGFGSAVLEMMQTEGLTRELLRLGMPDRFVEHATQKQQRESCGLDSAAVAKRVLERLQRPARSEAPVPEKPLENPVAFPSPLTLQ